MAGIMQVSNVVAVLQMLGGTVKDLRKVFLIEQIYQEFFSKDAKR